MKESQVFVIVNHGLKVLLYVHIVKKENFWFLSIFLPLHWHFSLRILVTHRRSLRTKQPKHLYKLNVQYSTRYILSVKTQICHILFYKILINIRSKPIPYMYIKRYLLFQKKKTFYWKKKYLNSYFSGQIFDEPL